VAGRLGERVGALSRQAGADSGRQRPAEFTGRVPVDGQFAGKHRWRDAAQLGPLGQRAGVAGMQPGPFAGQQVGLGDLAEQGMAKVVAVFTRAGHQ
jgi:hypothetical protein